MNFSEAITKIKSFDLSSYILAVDFDGTCVKHEFPRIGDDVPSAVEVLQALHAAGAKLILWTMRSDMLDICEDDGPNQAPAAEYLSDAAKWFADRQIPLHALNNNPQQSTWTSSPKCYAHLYIDDAAIGCPLAFDGVDSYVEWHEVALLLVARFEGKQRV